MATLCRKAFYLNNDHPNRTIACAGYHKLSQYLYFASCYGHAGDASFYDAVYACYYNDSKATRKIQRLQRHGIPTGSLRKFVPILYIDNHSRTIFSNSVEDVLSSHSTDAPLFELQSALLSVCRSYLKRSSLRGLVEQTDEELINKYGDMSLLSFYIYCVFCFFVYEDPEQREQLESASKQQKLISDVQDYAFGIKELVDNVVRHSDSHTGYLGIRIHSEDKLVGLAQRCPGYFEGSTRKGYYLEICVTDSYLPFQEEKALLSNCIMVHKFLENLEIRKEQEYHDQDDLKTICQFEEKFRCATLRDFFDPDPDPASGSFSMKDWDKFYSITANVLHHYGLMQFTSIVKSRKGYFKVRSARSFQGVADCQYCTETESHTENYYVPGTQYTIVLPIDLNAAQYATGFSAPNCELEFNRLGKLRQVDYPQLHQTWTKEICPKHLNENNAIFSASKTAYKLLSEWFAGNWRLSASVDDCDPVFSFDWQLFDGRLQEVFLKGLFYYIDATKDRTTPLRVAIYNCSYAALLQCSELFLAFYNRYSEQKAMRNVDIYLVDKSCESDFLISGENLKQATALSERTAFTKGRFSLLHAIFSTKMWARSDVALITHAPMSGEPIQYIPYDMLIQVDEKNTVFEKAVQLTLCTDIQGQDLGCRVTESHVRVGNKIHVIGDFYEAQELFHTPYYLQRFGYLIAASLFDSLQSRKQSGDIVLVGYETYSELLVITVEKFLNQKLKDSVGQSASPNVIERIIFENGDGGNDAVLRESCRSQNILSPDTNVVLIVPINSTLSTHNKVWAKLKANRRFANINAPAYNMAVILIRSGTTDALEPIEKNFWSKIDTQERKIITGLISPSVNYLISISTTWEDPLTCRGCYPTSGDLISETPIVDTNKASVIPTQMIGLKHHVGQPAGTPPQALEKNLQKCMRADIFLGPSDDFSMRPLHYGHIACNGNHFQYFFNTEALLDNILKSDKSTDLDAWLDWVKDKLETQKPGEDVPQANPQAVYQEYNILVIPEHKRNAAWVDQVIKKVFSNEPYVLRFNIAGEYRDNIKTKCSNISTLYKNLCDASKKAVIKFHFVDCTIASGRTFRRAETLMRSLFPNDAFDTGQPVQVRIFESIILILNRTSADTQRTYITNGNFFSYIHLPIPQVRNHGDACVLCNLEKRCTALAKRASTNEVAKRWIDKAKKHEVTHIDQLEQAENEFHLRYERRKELSTQEQAELIREQELRQKKAELSFRRLFCAQTAYTQINRLGSRRNDSDHVEEVIWSILRQTPGGQLTKREKVEYLISYIQVLSRPFLTFRKSVLEASFRVRLKLLTALLTGQEPTDGSAGLKDTVRILRNLCTVTKNQKSNQEKYKQLFSLLKVLAGSLTKNNSNYMIRKESYFRIFGFYSKSCLPLLPHEDAQCQRKEFEAWYINTVKRLLDSSGDETKCLWIEKLLITGSEWKSTEEDENFQREFGISSPLGQRIYLENTRILFDGVRDLCRNKTQPEIQGFLAGDKAPPYYLKNFTRFVNGSYTGTFEDPVSDDDLRLNPSPCVSEEILAMMDLYDQLHDPSLVAFGAVQSPAAAMGTEEFYKKLAKILAKASGAKHVVLYGEVLHPDKYGAVKNLLKRETDQIWQKKHWSDSKAKKDIAALTALCIDHALYEIASDFEQSTNCATEAEAEAEASKAEQQQRNMELLTSIIQWSDTGLTENRRSFWLDEARQAAVIHILDDGMQPVYFLLDFSQSSLEQPQRSMLQGVRNLLTFRHSLVQRFVRDFSNDLMPNYVQAQVNKGRLSRKNGWGHTSDRKLDFQMDHLGSGYAVAPEHTFEQVMQAYADQICGHLYLKYAQRQELPLYSELDVSEEGPFSFAQLKKLHGKELLENADITGRSTAILLRFNFSDQEDPGNSVMVLGKESHIISAIFLLANNTMKYGAAHSVPGEKDLAKTELDIRLDGHYLVISSPMLYESEETTRQYIDRATARLNKPPVGDDSISLWTIGQYIQDIVAKHEWSKFKDALSKARSQAAVYTASAEFFQKLTKQLKTCVDIKLEFDGGVPEYDQNNYITNARFVVRFPILLNN